GRNDDDPDATEDDMSKWIEPSADTKYVCNDGVVMTWVSIWGKERMFQFPGAFEQRFLSL
uniref:hypothetical protein n=1 Tax=Collinsella aerofaciens TaxID=74426 RepID=UPI0034A2CB25